MSCPIEMIIDVTKQTFNDCKNLLLKKGREYQANCGKQINVFSNFERAGKNLDLNRETVLAVYMAKHFDSLTTFINDLKSGKTLIEINKSLSEPIEGRISDAINYILLFNGMLTINSYQTENSKLFEFACEEMISLVSDYVMKIDNENILTTRLFEMLFKDFNLILQQIKYLQNKERFHKELNDFSYTEFKHLLKETITLLIILKIKIIKQQCEIKILN